MLLEDGTFASFLKNNLVRLGCHDSLSHVIIQIDNEQFHLPRLTLAASSHFFRALLLNPSFEEHKQPVIKLQTDLSTFELILNFLNTSTIDITEDNVYSLMASVDMFELSPLRLCISQYLLETISIDNCINVYAASVRYHYEDIATLALNFCVSHLNQLVDCTELMHLSYDLISKMFVSRLRDVPNEGVMIKLALMWVKFSPEERMSTLHNLLSQINLCQVPANILELAKSDTVLMNQIHFQSRLRIAEREKVMYENCTGKMRALSLNGASTYPSEQEIVLAIGGDSRGVPVRSVECAMPDGLSWKSVIPEFLVIGESPSATRAIPLLLQYRTGAAVASNKYRVYIIGGITGKEPTASCESYNVRTNCWGPLPSLPEPVEGAAAAFCNGRIYVSGGKGSDNFFQLHPYLNVWKSLPPLPEIRYQHEMVACNGFLYIIGGLVGEDNIHSSSVWRFDTYVQEWLEIPVMSECRAQFGATALDGRIYVMGGRHGDCVLKSAEMYDVLKNRWTPIADMLSHRYLFSSTTYNNRIICIGGCDNLQDSLDTVLRYTPRSNRWHCCVNMLRGRCGLAAATVNIPELRKDKL